MTPSISASVRSSSAAFAGAEAAVDDELQALADGEHRAGGDDQRDRRVDHLRAGTGRRKRADTGDRLNAVTGESGAGSRRVSERAIGDRVRSIGCIWTWGAGRVNKARSATRVQSPCSSHLAGFP